jgi:ferredoxin-NADP reductase/ferredoxin
MLVHFEGEAIELAPEETVLQGIERHGLALPAYCRSGVCRACLVKARRGTVPAAAQRGLKEAHRQQGLFLACQCRPTEALEVERCEGGAWHPSRVERVERLTGSVLRVFLSAPEGFAHQAGQFLQLQRPADGVCRAYSIASLPGSALELHVALQPEGAISQWLPAAIGEVVLLRGPFGECHYLEGEIERPLCLAGSGTGLAPLLGVVRAALAAGHRGPIRLYHGSVRRSGLYLWEEVSALRRAHDNLRVTGSVLEGDAGAAGAGDVAIRCQPLAAAIAADGPPRADERVFLCGNPELVRALQKRFYLSGVPLSQIHADAFVAPGAST